MSLKWPIALLILILPLAVLLWRRFKKPLTRPIFVAGSESIKNLPSYKKVIKRAKLFKYAEISLLTLIIISLALLVARPVAPSNSYSVEKSRDVVLLLDVSGSMKEVIPTMIYKLEEIVKANPSERFSIVTFRGLSNTVLPLTRDPVAIADSIELLKQVYEKNNDPNYAFSGLNGTNTDIGEGILGAVNRFDNLETYKSRNIILLSDLEQTGGDLDPNSEFYLEKVNLIPKYRINFFILKTPAEFSFAVNNEIAEYGGAKVYEIDKENRDESVRQLSDDIFKQILNDSRYASKNLSDSPNIVIFFTIILSISLVGIRLIRRKKL